MLGKCCKFGLSLMVLKSNQEAETETTNNQYPILLKSSKEKKSS